MGGSSVLMASHFAHLGSERGPRLPQGKSGCLTCHAPGIEQCKTESNPLGAPVFADGTPEVPRFLADTTVCDPCHSKDGNYDGVVMAKANWDDGVYNKAGDALVVEDWCAGCHDDAPCTIYGVSAPNVMGDSGQNYGYEISGHGRPSAEPEFPDGLKCEHCHDLTLRHFDAEPRTYMAWRGNYKEGYRLKKNMIVPRPGAEIEDGTFELCTSCHDYTVLTSTTNFRSVPMESTNPCSHPGINERNWHNYHLAEGTTYRCGDSDFDGEVDSFTTCILCHNVHGSPMDFGASTNIQVDDFNAYTDHTSIRGTWVRGKDAYPPYLAPSYGPDGSNCMAMKVSWPLDPADLGYEWRAIAPIDLTLMDYISFYVKVNDVSKIQSIKVVLRRNQDGIWTGDSYSTSQLGLQSGVWKLVSFPKEFFDLGSGEVNGVALVAVENDPGQSYATWVLFDDLRFVLSGTADYHPNPVMIRHGELISTRGTTDKVPAFDFKWYGGDCTEPGQPTVSVEASRWGRMMAGSSNQDLQINHVCGGCHNVARPGLEYGEIQYYRELLE